MSRKSLDRSVPAAVALVFTKGGREERDWAADSVGSTDRARTEINGQLQ